MSERPDNRQASDATPPAVPADGAPAAAKDDPAGSTVGTGSSLGIGCAVLMLIVFLALAFVFFLPYIRR